MGILLFLLLVALLFGLGGLFTAAKWLLIVAVFLALVSVLGFGRNSRL